MEIGINLLNLQNSYLVGSFVAVIFGLALALLTLIIILWLYVSFAYLALAKKIKYKYPHLSWIPLFGPAIIAYSANKKHTWYPWLLIVIAPIPILGVLAILTFFGFFIYWNWNLFEKVHKPGWWSLFMIMPLGNIAFLALLGVAAWTKK